MKSILIICGPTGVGKTSLAIKIARKLNGEILSADSRQVYRHMNVITGKDLSKNFKYQISNIKFQNTNIAFYTDNVIKIWGLDIVEPNKDFSVRHYVEYARIVLDNIWKRNKHAIIVGGTGYYLTQLIKPSETMSVPNNVILRKKLKTLTVTQLYEVLMMLDSDKAMKMNNSDSHNPRRLTRAIEIAYYQKSLGQNRQKIQPDSQTESISTEFILWIGLTIKDRKLLYQRIDDRVEKRIGSKINQELQYLFDNNFFSGAPLYTIGYREWAAYMHGKNSKENAILRWKCEEHAYARRQIVWFRKHKNIQWFDVTDAKYPQNVLDYIDTWYTKCI